MQSAQESKQELEAAIRYAENAISSANKTIESMEFRQEMAKKEYAEQTGRETALEAEVKALKEANMSLVCDNDDLKDELQRQKELSQKYYDNMMTFKAEVEKLRSEKEASSGPCGCQAYRDLEEARGRAEGEVELLQRTISDLQRELTIKTSQAEAWKKEARELKEGAPTMPVIPKDVAIAIFREGVQSGINDAVAELEGQRIDVEESEYVGGFEVSFSKIIDLDDELDLDWMRDKVGQYNEEFVVDALKGLCADKEFECRIHGIDNQES